MENILQADIFFFVTTIAVVAVSAVAIVALVYLVLILRIVRRLMKQVEEKAADISVDVDDMRQVIRGKVVHVSQMITAFSAARVAERIIRFFEDKGKEMKRGRGRKKKDESENAGPEEN